jgi:membrane protease YdiL (CAAX protease family)
MGASNQLIETPESTVAPFATVVAVGIVAALSVAVGEELIYRQLVQKSLSQTLSKANSIGISSMIFTLSHLPAYTGVVSSDPVWRLSTIVPLTQVLCMSLIAGWYYQKHESLLVPIIVHAGYNLIGHVHAYLIL